MIRTRDFLLVISVIVFLLVGIGSTLVINYFNQEAASGLDVNFVVDNEAQYVASAENTLLADRQARLEDIKNKIAAGAKLYIYEEEIEEEELTLDESDFVGIQYCSNYQENGISFDQTGLILKEVEGARLLYFEVPASLTATTTLQEREILLELPIPTSLQPDKICLRSNVVGVTLGGQLILNSDYARFGVFGETMLIGYALDGFPIYGGSTASLDNCGGQVVGGQYRYQVSMERESILQCYSGIPANI